MVATKDETAGGGGGDGGGLPGSPMNAPTQGALGGMMARKRADLLAADQILADLAARDRIVRKVDVGRRPEAVREMPVRKHDDIDTVVPSGVEVSRFGQQALET